MERYRNLNGDSGIAFYAIGDDHIWIEFASGSPYRKYRYTNASAGTGNIAHMKQLATEGRGLNSFINKNPRVRKGYDKRE